MLSCVKDRFFFKHEPNIYGFAYIIRVNEVELQLTILTKKLTKQT